MSDRWLSEQTNWNRLWRLGGGAAIALLASAALPAAAAEPTPRAVFQEALRSGTLDQAAFDEAVERVRAAGEPVSLGLYRDNAVTALADPVTVTVPESFAYVCDNKTFAMGAPEGTFPDSEDVYEVVDEGDGTKRITFTTTDADGTLRLEFITDGEAVSVERLSGDGAGETFEIFLAEDGTTYRDADTGDMFSADAPTLLVFSQLAKSAMAAHPFWFANGRQLQSGDPFMEDALRDTVEPMVAALAGAAEAQGDEGASFDVGVLVAVLSGAVMLPEGLHVLFEGGFTATAQISGGDVDFEVTFVELYSAQTFLLRESTQDLKVTMANGALRSSNHVRCSQQ